MATPLSPRQEAREAARKIRQASPVFLDTETTGLSSTDEIVEISVIDIDGNVLIDKLVRPSHLIPSDAFRIHGISNDMVKTAQPWPVLWMQVRPLLLGKIVVAYNSDFDFRMMRQSHERYKQPWRDSLQMFDLMKLYSQYRGDWGARRFFSLEEAGKHSNISLPNAHRSLADTLLARALLNFIADSA